MIFYNKNKIIKRGVVPLLFFFFAINFAKELGNLEVLDEIVCSKISDSGVSVVFLSDSWLKNPMGLNQSIEEKIINMLWIAHGQEHGMKILSDGSYNEYAEEYFQKIQTERGVTRDQIKEMCKKSGFSIEDLKKELNEKNFITQIVQTTISAKSLFNVNSKEIEDFFFQYPEYTEETYIIQRGSFKGKISELPFKISGNEIKWESPYSIKKNELSSSFAVIDKISEGEFITVIQFGESVEIYKLISSFPAKLISLEERFEKISYFLQNKKFKESYIEMTKELIEDSSVNFKSRIYKDLCLEFLEKMQN